MNKVGRVALIVGVLLMSVLIFVVVPIWVGRSVAVWHLHWRYVEEVSNLTGLNHYIVTAAGLLLFIPVWFGAKMAMSVRSSRDRYLGAGIILGLAVLYNVGLFWATRETSFAFATGASMKWYAVTPEGVKYFDRAGVEPKYGVPLQPVTPQVARQLEMMERGTVRPVDPERVTLFNPNTGQAQAWYYRYPDGNLEFYDRPGHHPVTGTLLQPVTQEIILEWRKRERARPQALQAPASGQPSGTPTAATPATTGTIRSDPEGADAYLDWKPRGRTPTQFEDKNSRGLLVIVKDGYRAAFKRVDPRAEGEIEFTLQPDAPHSRKRLLVVLAEGPSEAASALRAQLIGQGFSVLGLEEGREFERERDRAGGLSNPALRAWARARFETDLVVMVRARQTSRELSDQEFGHLGIREAVKGATRTEVGIDVEVIDLRSGDSVTAASSKGSGFALDRSQGAQKAATQAATESAKVLKERLQG